MSVLAGYANSSLSRLSRAVLRLETRGWVNRTPDPADGRYTLAMLTEAGAGEVGDATPGHVATVRRLVLDPLTAAQQAATRDQPADPARDQGGRWLGTGVAYVRELGRRAAAGT